MGYDKSPPSKCTERNILGLHCIYICCLALLIYRTFHSPLSHSPTDLILTNGAAAAANMMTVQTQRGLVLLVLTVAKFTKEKVSGNKHKKLPDKNTKA